MRAVPYPSQVVGSEWSWADGSGWLAGWGLAQPGWVWRNLRRSHIGPARPCARCEGPLGACLCAVRAVPDRPNASVPGRTGRARRGRAGRGRDFGPGPGVPCYGPNRVCENPKGWWAGAKNRKLTEDRGSTCRLSTQIADFARSQNACQTCKAKVVAKSSTRFVRFCDKLRSSNFCLMLIAILATRSFGRARQSRCDSYLSTQIADLLCGGEFAYL